MYSWSRWIWQSSTATPMHIDARIAVAYENFAMTETATTDANANTNHAVSTCTRGVGTCV